MPRPQVPEPQYGPGVQPVANPALSSPILRAPNIYPDDTAKGLQEFANNFTAGFAKLKQVQTQQDTILGEELFLREQPTFAGIFDNASGVLDSEGKLVRARQIAEDTSLGTRIGFERAVGRMMASKEQEIISNSIMDTALSSNGDDPGTGLPNNPSIFQMDQAIAEARKNFRDQVSNGQAAWVLSSPYATEEYTSNMARLLPEAIEKGRSELLKIKQTKFREQLMQEASTLIAREMASVGQVGADGKIITAESAYQKLGGFIKDNVVRAGIANPREFVLDAMFNASQIAMNPITLPDGTKRINTALAERIFDGMAGFNYDGATLIGGDLAQKYWQYYNHLQTRIVAANKAQDPDDRKKLALDAVRRGIVPGPDGKTSLYDSLVDIYRSEGVTGVESAIAQWQSSLQSDNPYFKDQFFIASKLSEDFKSRSDSFTDLSAINNMKKSLATGDITSATELLGAIKDPVLLNEATKLRQTYIDSKSAPVLNSPLIKQELEVFKNSDDYITRSLVDAGVDIDLVPVQLRQSLVNQIERGREQLLLDVQSSRDSVMTNRIKTAEQQIKSIKDGINNRIVESWKPIQELSRKVSDVNNKGESAVADIENAYRVDRIIDKKTYDKLIERDKSANQWQEDVAKADIGKQMEVFVRSAVLSTDGTPFTVKYGTAGNEKIELSILGREKANSLTNKVIERIKSNVLEFDPATKTRPIDNIRKPGGDIYLKKLIDDVMLDEMKNDKDITPDALWVSRKDQDPIVKLINTGTNVVSPNEAVAYRRAEANMLGITADGIPSTDPYFRAFSSENNKTGAKLYGYRLQNQFINDNAWNHAGLTIGSTRAGDSEVGTNTDVNNLYLAYLKQSKYPGTIDKEEHYKLTPDKILKLADDAYRSLIDDATKTLNDEAAMKRLVTAKTVKGITKDEWDQGVLVDGNGKPRGKFTAGQLGWYTGQVIPGEYLTNPSYRGIITKKLDGLGITDVNLQNELISIQTTILSRNNKYTLEVSK